VWGEGLRARDLEGRGRWREEIGVSIGWMLVGVAEKVACSSLEGSVAKGR